MSGPFRSELEQLQELLRRAETRASALEEERRELEALVGRRHQASWGAMVALSASLALGASGYAVGHGEGAAERERLRLEIAQGHMDQLRCLEGSALQSTQLDTLREICRGLEGARRAEPSGLDLPGASSPRPCRCQPGDPLCACLADAPFDRAAARRAFGDIDLRSCFGLAPPEHVHVQVIFQPSGTVGAVSVVQPDDLPSLERSCVDARLRDARIPPFSGGAVKVGKSFVVVGR